MSSDNLAFKTALITGGGGGIGLALAKWLVSEGKQVIIAGRTESKLQSAVQDLGSAASYYVLDTGKVADIPTFVQRVVHERPDLDCLINNAGIQRPFDIPHGFDLAKADEELDINIRGPMHLAIGLLPHLQTKPGATIVNVSSVLGYIPFSIVNPVYNGTKAWMHFWTMNLRTQLADTGVRVLEIAPPTVATDLHRERADPDDNKKEKNPNALTTEEFMSEVTRQWKAGETVLSAGMGKSVADRWYREFWPDYSKASGGK